MDLSPKYQILLDYFERSSNDAIHFIQEKGPFEDIYTAFDGVHQKLISDDSETIQCLAISLSQALFSALYILLKRMVSDHLQGSKFHSPSDEVISESQSVVPHNKIPEFAFGQLDFLTRYRPNATALINESFLMYAMNKTSQWLEFMPEDEKEKLLLSVRCESKKIVAKFKGRNQQIKQERIQRLQAKEDAIKAKKARMVKWERNWLEA